MVGNAALRCAARGLYDENAPFDELLLAASEEKY